MESLRFYKYHGLENDFIIFDIRRFDFKIENNVDKNQIEIFNMICKNAKSVCNRQDGLGADGVIIITSTYLQQTINSNNNVNTKVYDENDNILCTMR